MTTINLLLMKNLINDSRTNLSQWFEKIVDKFCEEQAIEECTSFDEIKSIFHDDLHKCFLCTVPTFVFKFLIDNGVADIVKPIPPLAIPCYTDWHKRKREWEYFLSK